MTKQMEELALIGLSALALIGAGWALVEYAVTQDYEQISILWACVVAIMLIMRLIEKPWEK